MAKAPGDRIGRYIIDRRLGVGGMAEAYLAHQEGPAGFVKPVVVKVLLGQHATDPKMVDLFLREARVGARLNHTNIVQIFDLGQSDSGEHFIAMEYVDGLTLLQVAKRCWAMGTGLPMDVAVRVVAAASVGLHYAHTLKSPDGTFWGVVHRDISPDNLIIARDGTVKLLDFGVAKLRGSESTQTGEIKGKIPFMSPEQLEADVEVDARCDLWALGVTLYWCLVGKRPFSGPNDVHVIRAILEQQPDPPSSLNKSVWPELDDVVMNLLEKDREKRIASGAKLAARLQRMVPATQGNPLAKFIEKMVMFNDDPPEAKVKTGSGIRGLPASPIAADSTDLVMRNATHDAQLLSSGEGPEPFLGERTLPGDDDQIPSTGGSGGWSAQETVRVAREDLARVATPRSKNRVLLAALGGAAVVTTVLGVVLALTSKTAEPPAAKSAAVDAGAAGVDAKLADAATNSADAGATHADPDVAAEVPAEPPVELPVEPLGQVPPVKGREPRVVATRTVLTTAPERVHWTTMSGKPLGTGSHALMVPDVDKTIIAIDTGRDARVLVAVAPKIDWGSLPKAKLVVRALPYATEVKLGNESLGPTPVQPQSVVAGLSATYRVMFFKDKQSMAKVVKVKPGEDAVAAVTMK